MKQKLYITYGQLNCFIAFKICFKVEIKLSEVLGIGSILFAASKGNIYIFLDIFGFYSLIPSFVR